MEFKKWVKIHQFHNTRKEIKRKIDYQFSVGNVVPFPKVTYRAKVKLDGTNAAIRIKDGEVKVQSRSRFITPEDDNYGFATWVYKNMGFFTSIPVPSNVDFCVYGEWAGKGVQRRTSVSKVDRKFFPFAIVQEALIFTNPDNIHDALGDHDDIFSIPYLDGTYTVDYGSAESLSLFLERVNALCDQVEKCDPFIRDLYNIEGLGEGVVMYPETPIMGLEECSSLMFKVKGEEHETVRQKRPAILDPEVVNSISAFTQKFVTPARLEQAVREGCNGEIDVKKTGDFLKWIGNDVKLESEDELEVAGLEWKHVAKKVSHTAREWWIKECQKI